MDWLFEFDRAPHYVTVTATGQALATEFGQLFKALCAHERFEPGMLILLDLRTLDLNRVPQMELEKVSKGLGTLRALDAKAARWRRLHSAAYNLADPGRRRRRPLAPRMQVWVANTVDEAINVALDTARAPRRPTTLGPKVRARCRRSPPSCASANLTPEPRRIRPLAERTPRARPRSR